MQGYVARKGNRWYAVVYEGLDPTTGRERRRWYPAGADRKNAETLAHQLATAETERRGDGRSRLTFAGFVHRHWLPAKRVQLRPSTIDGYERNLQLHILPGIGDIPLRDVRSEHLEGFYGRLLIDGRVDGEGGLSAKSVHELHVIIRNIGDDAVRRGLLISNPARVAASPKHRRDPHRRRMAWSAEELALFLEATADHRHHDGFWLAADTGMRRSELLGLRWRDIDVPHSRVSIVQTVVCVGTRVQVSPGKTVRSARTIDLDPDTVAVLKGWRARHRELFGDDDVNRLLFTKPDGQLLHPQALSQSFEKAVAKTDLPRISLHGLRHTHATLLLKRGAPTKVVTERLGHATPSFTMATYQHIIPGMQAAAAADFSIMLREARAELDAASTGSRPVEEPVEENRTAL